ncbi:cutinase family protein [Rhodococcus sp. IEGM 1351]|uniref:cutinase family protein n=1 Tax=Rhodococcus sp. IEGM 1351 TaxID=3047089 RepID=UPI0024B64ED1|nr:cutinase family protein [Rhodococcus sp. IEGM 1351]MDI9940385.1 cutinase family protein [Rhodococcus sp. IEGM 1351]
METVQISGGGAPRPVRRLAASAVVGAVAVAVSVGANAVPAHASTNWVDQLVQDCPALFVLGGQGTGESSPDAPVKADTGMLSNIMSPLLDQARQLGVDVDRAYVPYPAAFGGAVPGGKESYAVSVSTAKDNLQTAAEKVLDSCPATKLAIAAYSQFAHAASEWLTEVGAGKVSGVPASSIASAALFGSPTRAEGAGIFPGTSQTTPSPVPGTSGSAVKALPAVTVTTATGAGIGPVADTVTGFGSLTGRVSMWCQTGDLACDAPPKAPIARAVANVAGQAEVGGDPFVAVQTIGLALASTAFNVGVDVINEDIQVPKNSLENLSITPKKTLSQRLAEGSDPRATPPTGQEAISALMKVGLVAVNSVVTVAKKVITPETIAAVAAVGLANPVAAFAIIAAKTVNAVINLVPPATTQRLVKQTFDLVKGEVKANKDLFDLAALTKYSNIQAAHGSYGSSAATATGLAPTAYVAKMFAAVASDLSTSNKTSSSSSSSTSTTRPSATSLAPTTSRPTSSSSATSSATPTSSTSVATSTDSTFSQNGLTTDSSTEGNSTHG